MIKRKKKIIFAQITLFILGVFIIIYTYYNKRESTELIIPSNQKKIVNTLNNQEHVNEDIF